MRVTTIELQKQLGSTIDLARDEPVVVTTHGRNHVVIVSAERYALISTAMRHVRSTGSLTDLDRQLAMAADVPSEVEQARDLAEFALASEPQR
jgi:prevent-host-death family protein